MAGVNKIFKKLGNCKQRSLFFIVICTLNISLLHPKELISFNQIKNFSVFNNDNKKRVQFDRINQLNTLNSNWNASWIWQQSDGPANTWACFRKTFVLDVLPETAFARIAVDSKYWLWINGHEVVFEGGLKRGPTPQDTYFDFLDLKDYLIVGENVIAIKVWYFGKNGFSHLDSGKGGLLFECNAGNNIIKSDSTWKILIHPAYEKLTVNNQPNARLSESIVRFNAVNNTISAWKDINFDDSLWTAAIEKGTPPSAPWNNLWFRPIPHWKNTGLRDYKNITVEGQSVTLPYTTSKRVYLVADLPYNAQITPYLEIETTEKKEIFIQSDSYYNWRDKSVMAEYVAAPGTSEYESLGWMNGHKILYSIPVGVTVKALKYRETGYDVELSGNFFSSDEFYEKLWKKSQRTLYLAMRDNYMDCPDRERALWWGDAVTQIGITFYALDRNADLLTKKSIRNLINWQRGDDVLYAPVPSGNWNQELPAQMLTSIGEFGFWDYYMHTGDSTIISEVYPNVKRYLNLWSQKINGLITYRPGNWDWSDWGENIDSELIQNAWYYLAIRAAKKMAVIAGNSNDTTVYLNRMHVMQSRFNEVFWNGNEYRTPTYTGLSDDRANALAVLAGFADVSKYEKIRNLLMTRRGASPYMEKYVLEALFIMGYEKDALTRMKHPDRYKSMVEDTGTTLFEYFGNEGSNNHAWSGGPLILLSRYCAGVAPLTPAYDTYTVFPQQGDLEFISTIVPSIKGNIGVQIVKDSTNYQMNLISPQKTKARVGIPIYPFDNMKVDTIKLNGKLIWAKNKYADVNTNVSYGGLTNKYIVFDVLPGNYIFEAKSTKQVSLSNNQGDVAKLYNCSMYPNPSRDQLYIQFDQSGLPVTNLSIYNLHGKLISTHNVADFYINLDISGLKSGMYIVKMVNGQNSFIKSFVKE